MSVVTYEPNAEQEFLILNALRGEPDAVLPRTQFIEEIYDSRYWLPHLFEQGIDYVACFENQQAYSVIRNSPWATEISFKVAIPYSLSVFRLRGEPRLEPVRRRNPEEESLLSEEDIQPDVSWFENFRLRYTDWRKAWWREILQNSVDACLEAPDRKHKIVCSLYTFANSEEVRVTVSDNGVGMDLATLKNAFLKPGGSGKREMTAGRAATGGLGKAKEMLFHAWPEWSVWTQKEGGKGYFVKARYGPYMKGNLLESSERSRETPGTKISVTMKADRRITKADLLDFIELSSFPNIKVIYRKFHVDGNKVEKEEEETLKAKNNITTDEPIKILSRGDGSPWGEVYHMPRARNFKQVVIRANGLYLFSAPGSYDVPGKVIIELKYKPKGHRWSVHDDAWVPMDPEAAAVQNMEDYGPLELLTESRDGLLWRQRYTLDDFLESLIKRPEVTLKKTRKKKRVRATSKQREKPNFDELFEVVQPKEIMDRPEETLADMRALEEGEVLRRFMRALRQGQIVLADPATINEHFTDGQISILKTLMKRPDIAQRVQQVVGGPAAQEETTEEGEFVEAEEEAESVNLEQIVEAIDEVEYSAISTAVDSTLYELYADILKPLLQEAKEEGKGHDYAENIIKMLKWEPDVIFSDETEPPTPRPPEKYSPVFFGARERQIAKFWVECIRLVHMIQGNVNLDLDTGFLFENPGSDAFLGEYIAESGGDDDEYTQDIGAFKAVLIAPADISKSNKWVHRYKLRSYRDVEKVVSIAFHEAVHATLHRVDESNDHSHNHVFASMITDDLTLAMRHASAFYKLAKFCADLYPIRGHGAARAVRRGKASKGMGYYTVKCKGRRGRPPKFTRLQDARDFVAKYHTDYPYSSCSIYANFKPEEGDDVEAIGWGSLETVYNKDYKLSPLQERLEELHETWDDDYRNSYRSGHSSTKGKDIFKRKRRSLKRRDR